MRPVGQQVYDQALKPYDDEKITLTQALRIAEAPSHGKPVLLYDLRCPGSQAYVMLAAELIRREARPAGVTP